MDDEELSLMHFVMNEEARDWKVVEFRFDNVLAVNSEGKALAFSHADEAKKFIRARAMEAALKHYHSEMAKGNRA